MFGYPHGEPPPPNIDWALGRAVPHARRLGMNRRPRRRRAPRNRSLRQWAGILAIVAVAAVVGGPELATRVYEEITGTPMWTQTAPTQIASGMGSVW